MAGITRGARAVWQGSGKEGAGVITTDSGVLADTPYSFSRRFGDEKGSNPEELIAAAHAGCFAMALSFGLGQAGFTPTSLDATAKVTVAPVEGGFAISGSALTLKAVVPGISHDQFGAIVEGAKAGCPISKVLSCPITLAWELA
ncbi:OsmC family protein [Elioraea sp.]|uniref:OsmC family protein n=1 Tax=Elioraea sp. TaxID=2185103 RepID=UPI0025BF9469|nr:OsmC family protein [Elioraea sp.]